MLLFFITNFFFVFSSLGYLYFFNMFRWDAHLVVTYSANCRGVPLPFLLWCVYVCMCTFVLLLYLFLKLFPLDIADCEVTVFSQLIIHHHTRKWNFFFLIENNKMCDGLYAWLDFLAGFTLFTFDRIFFYMYIFSRVYVILWYYIFSIFISRDENYIVTINGCVWWEINLNLATFSYSITNLTW